MRMPPLHRACAAAALALALHAPLAAATAPDQSIRETTEKLQSLIRENHAHYRADPARFHRLVDELIVPCFNQEAAGRLVLGRYWRAATPEQRQRFVAAFKNNLVYSYADALLDYHDTVKTRWKPVHRAPDASEATVNVDLLREDGPPIALGFAVRADDNGWKIYDVAVEGVSLAAAFRSQFGAEIKKNGLDDLIRRLESGAKPLPQQAVGRESDT